MSGESFPAATRCGATVWLGESGVSLGWGITPTGQRRVSTPITPGVSIFRTDYVRERHTHPQGSHAVRRYPQVRAAEPYRVRPPAADAADRYVALPLPPLRLDRLSYPRSRTDKGGRCGYTQGSGRSPRRWWAGTWSEWHRTCHTCTHTMCVSERRSLRLVLCWRDVTRRTPRRAQRERACPQPSCVRAGRHADDGDVANALRRPVRI